MRTVSSVWVKASVAQWGTQRYFRGTEWYFRGTSAVPRRVPNGISEVPYGTSEVLQRYFGRYRAVVPLPLTVLLLRFF